MLKHGYATSPLEDAAEWPWDGRPDPDSDVPEIEDDGTGGFGGPVITEGGEGDG